jgi:hypothetical protein
MGSAYVAPFSVLPVGPRRWKVVIEAPIEPPDAESGDAGEVATMQALADRWTTLLRSHPQHWSAVFPIAWEPA